MTRTSLFAILLIMLLGCTHSIPVNNAIGLQIPHASLVTLQQLAEEQNAKIKSIEFAIYFHPLDQAVAVVHYAPNRNTKTISYPSLIFTNDAWPTRLATGRSVSEYKEQLAQPNTKWSLNSKDFHQDIRHIFQVGGSRGEIRLGQGISYSQASSLLQGLPSIQRSSTHCPQLDLSNIISIERDSSTNGYIIGVGEMYIVVEQTDGTFIFVGFQIRRS